MSKPKVKEIAPRYGVVDPEFYCPIGNCIMWHRGLKYKECPLSQEHRDMRACEKCIHGKGMGTKSKHKKNNRRKQNTSKQKELVPKIGATYNS